MKKYVTTLGGLKRLTARLQAARKEYEAILAQTPEDAAAGDNSVWHDNFAFEENQRQQHQRAKRVHELQNLLREIEVATPPTNPQRVAIGVVVVVLDVNTKLESRYLLAGFEDGDPPLGRVSYTSPLGRILLGAEVGEVRRLPILGVVREFEIISIEAAPEDES